MILKIFKTKTEHILSALAMTAVVASSAATTVEATTVYEYDGASTMTITDTTSYSSDYSTDCVIKMQTNCNETGEALNGASYRIYKTTGEFVGTFSADETGTAISQPLDAGTYLVKQIVAPEGYLLSTNTVTIDTTGHPAGSLLPAQFWCEKMAGLVIQNVIQESYEPLEGCVFAVYNEAGTQVFAGTSPITGVLETGIVEPGFYTVKQLTTIEGYSITQVTRVVEVKLNEDTTTVFENTSLTNVRIYAIDSATRNPIPDAVFKVEDSNGAIIATVITDVDGSALVSNLPIGNYMVKQFSAPSGYVLDTNYQSITVQQGMDKELTFLNSAISGMVIRAVVTADYSPVSGAVFDIYGPDGTLLKTVSSDSTGVIYVNDLEPGDYLVKEIVTPAGYASSTPTQTVTITYDDPTTATFLHQQTAVVIVALKDAVSGDVVPNAGYQIRTIGGEYIGDYVTDVSGQITLTDLPSGEYTLVQTTVPDGYILDSTSRTFTIVNEQTIKIDLTINKTAHVIITCMDKATTAPIRDAQFKILDMNGQYVGTYTTDELGQLSAPLSPGTYTAVQISVNSNFELNSQPITFVIHENQNVHLEVYNEQYTRLRVRVVDEATQNGIYFCEVELKDELNNSLGRFTTDNEGYIYFEDTIPEGRYTLTLISVPSGYTMDNIPRTFTMEHGVTTEYIFELGGHYGQICITTFAGEDSADMNIWKNTKIAGGTFNITDASGKLVATISGDSSGNAYTGALPYGTYYIEQVTAPVGFMVNSTRATVTISENSDIKKIDFYCKASNFVMTVSVRGEQTTQAGSTNKHYISDVKGSSTNAMQNFFLNINIPAQHVEAAKIFTGTWNTNTVYNIEYKTNQSDYRTLASGLSSFSQYSYDIDPTSLALSTGEYVTDVRFVFGSVSAGFTEVMTPTIYTTVRDTTVHGTNYTIRAEIAGVIDNNWYVGAGEFQATGTNLFTGNTGGYTYYPSLFNFNGGNNIVVGGLTTYPSSLPTTGY